MDWFLFVFSSLQRNSGVLETQLRIGEQRFERADRETEAAEAAEVDAVGAGGVATAAVVGHVLPEVEVAIRTAARAARAAEAELVVSCDE